MFNRPSKPATPLNQKQAELAREETHLRDEMRKLERVIKEAPRAAEEVSRRQREELVRRATEGGDRLDVSMTLQDKRFGLDDAGPVRRGSLRKERREGRIIFLVLVIALTTLVVWLVTHLHL